MSQVELFLNLCWLFIGLGGVSLWAGWWHRRDRRGRLSSWLELVAIICAVAALFPAISMTDDMQAQWLALEEPVTFRALSGGGIKHGICRLPEHPPRLAAVLNDGPFRHPGWSSLRWLDDVGSAPFVGWLSDSWGNRSPPIFFF